MWTSGLEVRQTFPFLSRAAFRFSEKLIQGQDEMCKRGIGGNVCDAQGGGSESGQSLHTET